MGLDIALGVMIFIGAVRGWFRGFLLQAIRLGGIVGAVYLAAPVRDLARPYVAPYLTTIRPDLLDRMLWWASGVLCYLVTVGLATMVVNMQRRRPYGDPEVGRADQGAGFLLAAVKSAVVVAFLVASLDKYATSWAQSVPWADEQARTSMALAWERQYRPADQIWASAPVQQFVGHVRKMGLSGAGDLATPASILTGPLIPQLAPPQAATAEVAGRNPRLGLPPVQHLRADMLPPPDATEAEVAQKINETVEALNHP